LVSLYHQILHGLELATAAVGSARLLPLVPPLEKSIKQTHQRFLSSQTRLQLSQFLLRNLQDLREALAGSKHH
jgi:hypothetical protein